MKRRFTKYVPQQNKYSVSITPIQNSGLYSGTISISTSLLQDDTECIRYYIDNKYIGIIQAPPFDLELDTSVLQNGKHKLRISITWKYGGVSTSYYPLTTNNLNNQIQLNETKRGILFGGKDVVWKFHIPFLPPPSIVIKATPVKNNIQGRKSNPFVLTLPNINMSVSYESEMNVNHKSTNSEIIINSPLPGDYYIKLQSDKTGDYELSIETGITANSSKALYNWTPGNKYAIVIGISDYLFINDLNYCDEDAVSWCNYLTQKGYEIKLFGDMKSNYSPYKPVAIATENNIRQYITSLSKIVKPGDKVLFISSGHGSGDGKGYSWLCCLDEKGKAQGEYDDKEIASDFKKITSKGAFVFFFCDNCYSGGIIEEVVTQCGQQNVFIATTCTDNGFGYDVEQNKHGAWTYEFLIKGLMDKYKDSNPSLDTVFASAVLSYPYKKKDTPQCGGNGKISL